MKRACLAWLAVGLAACGPSERLMALQKEVSELQASRIEKERVTTAHAEADATERKLADAKTEREQLIAEAEASKRELGRLQATFEAEQGRNARLRTEIEALAAEVQKLGQRRAEQAPKLEALREEASDERDQADGLARALRAEEPGWARQRRMVALREFLSDLSRKHARDPVLAGLADDAGAGASAEEVRAAAELAQKASERLTAVYELEANPPH